MSVTYSVELFLRENGARSCSMVGATFCLDVGVLEMCLRGRDIADFADTCRDLAQETQTQDSPRRILRDTFITFFCILGFLCGGAQTSLQES